MPPLEDSDLNQTAVLWAKTGDSQYTAPQTAPPVEIDVRWEDTTDQVVDGQGNVIELDARAVTNCPVPKGSLLWLGELADFSPTGDNDIMQVVRTGKTPDVKAREFRYSLNLVRYNGVVPS